MTIGTLPWDKIAKDLDRVILDLYGAKKHRYAKSGEIAEAALADPIKYPAFHSTYRVPLNRRGALQRVNHILGNVRGWTVYSRSTRSVYIIPEGYFDTVGDVQQVTRPVTAVT
jgi:hypothetical protein